MNPIKLESINHTDLNSICPYHFASVMQLHCLRPLQYIIQTHPHMYPHNVCVCDGESVSE